MRGAWPSLAAPVSPTRPPGFITGGRKVREREGGRHGIGKDIGEGLEVGMDERSDEIWGKEREKRRR